MSEQFSFRLTEPEFLVLGKLADDCEMNRAEFIRDVIRAIAKSVIKAADRDKMGFSRLPVSDNVHELLRRYGQNPPDSAERLRGRQ